MNRRLDSVSFILGMIMIAIAVVTLLLSCGIGSPEALKVVLPLFLVAVGVVALTMSRRRP